MCIGDYVTWVDQSDPSDIGIITRIEDAIATVMWIEGITTQHYVEDLLKIG